MEEASDTELFVARLEPVTYRLNGLGGIGDPDFVPGDPKR